MRPADNAGPPVLLFGRSGPAGNNFFRLAAIGEPRKIGVPRRVRRARELVELGKQLMPAAELT